MGIIESTLGNLIYNWLMPKEVPDWYNGRKLTFPQAPPGSLRLLGEVTLEVSDLGRARSFCDALAGEPPAEAGGDLRVRVGPSELRLAPRGEQAIAWHGHLYIWVRDLKRTLERLRVLEKSSGAELVESVHESGEEGRVSAVAVEDFDGNSFVLNEAPKGLPERLARLGVGEKQKVDANLVALIEALHAVPSGVAPSMGRFFHHYFGAAVEPKDAGWAVNLSPGRALRQTLTFADVGMEKISEEQVSETHMGDICFYMPTDASFMSAFEKLLEAGLVEEGLDAAQAEERQEFRTTRCVEPRTGKVVFQLKCIVRSPRHPECLAPLPALPQ